MNSLRTFLSFLASFRLRVLFRSAFLALALAVLAMAVTVLQEEKQRSYDNYALGFAKTKEQIVGRLRHPAGQLALLNPGWSADLATAGRPVVLPFSAIDFDDQNKVRNAIEMAGCLVHYPHDGSLCVAIGNNPWAGGYIYAAGTFASGPLEAHRIGDEFLDGAHRVRVTVGLRGQTWRWLAPYEPMAAAVGQEGARGRFTGYVEREGRDYTGARPVKEFRGWVWQAPRCLDEARDSHASVSAVANGTDMTTRSGQTPFALSLSKGMDQGASTSHGDSLRSSSARTEPGNGDAEVISTGADCARKSFFSLRLPVDALREALFQRAKPTWPPSDLDQFQVHVEVLPPGDGAALFDSHQPGAAPAFSLADITALLLPGETVVIKRVAGGKTIDVAQLAGREEALEQSSPLLTRLIRVLPVESLDAPVVELSDEVATPLGNYRLLLKGDARSVNKTLSAVATRVSWFVVAMLGAIGLAWLVIEIGIIRRIARLTRRTRGLSRSVHADGGLERYDLADLRGSDELGLLATGLDDLLRRVKEDAGRERIRAEQEKDMWHAVGHEIMSPLQSLLALHGSPADPSHRYISRMQQAVRVLYGRASPSEAFESSALQVQAIDIAEFIRHVAENADIADVRCVGAEAAVLVRADEFPLEDVFSHILRNADRHRTPGTPIAIRLEAGDTTVTVAIHNHGAPIREDLRERIFEYGVSDQPGQASGTNGSRGQGLFVAKTYMAKMGGTISVKNEVDGVSFVLGLQRVRG